MNFKFKVIKTHIFQQILEKKLLKRNKLNKLKIMQFKVIMILINFGDGKYYNN